MAEQQEAKVNIDGVEYLIKDLSDEAKGQLQSLQFVESELARLKAQVAITSTAKIAYQAGLKAALPSA